MRREHQKTEKRLRDQAKSLLSTTRSAIVEVHGLHEKISRLKELDRGNHERIAVLPEIWATDVLADPIRNLRDMAETVDGFCNRIRSALGKSDFRAATYTSE